MLLSKISTIFPALLKLLILQFGSEIEYWYGLIAVTVVRHQLNVSEINYSSVINIVLHDLCLPGSVQLAITQNIAKHN